MIEHYLSAIFIGWLYICGAISTVIALSTDSKLDDARRDRMVVLFAAVFWVFFWTSAFIAVLYDYAKGTRNVA